MLNPRKANLKSGYAEPPRHVLAGVTDGILGATCTCSVTDKAQATLGPARYSHGTPRYSKVQQTGHKHVPDRRYARAWPLHHPAPSWDHRAPPVYPPETHRVAQLSTYETSSWTPTLNVPAWQVHLKTTLTVLRTSLTGLKDNLTGPKDSLAGPKDSLAGPKAKGIVS